MPTAFYVVCCSQISKHSYLHKRNHHDDAKGSTERNEMKRAMMQSIN
jgi:hypothetical protein